MNFELKSNKYNEKTYVFNDNDTKPIPQTGTIPQKKRKTTVKTPAKPKPKKIKAETKNITKEKVHTIRAPKTIPFPTAIICMAIIATILFCFLIMSYVNINEYTINNEKLTFQLDNSLKQQKELTLELEKKNNLREIERYAKDILGMVKIDQLRKKYISIKNEDKIELIKPRTSFQDITNNIVDSIAKNFKSLLEYIN
ncbi:MAG: hypothetical protein FWF15_08630 [Oscillospiraceae bacterium]|nr:hypothetical protein [Oscillospiraceae bacterium]